MTSYRTLILTLSLLAPTSAVLSSSTAHAMFFCGPVMTNTLDRARAALGEPSAARITEFLAPLASDARSPLYPVTTRLFVEKSRSLPTSASVDVELLMRGPDLAERFDFDLRQGDAVTPIYAQGFALELLTRISAREVDVARGYPILVYELKRRTCDVNGSCLDVRVGLAIDPLERRLLAVRKLAVRANDGQVAEDTTLVAPGFRGNDFFSF